MISRNLRTSSTKTFYGSILRSQIRSISKNNSQQATAQSTSRPQPSPAFNTADTSTQPIINDPTLNKHQSSAISRKKKEQLMDDSFIGLTGGEIFHEMMLRHKVDTVFGYAGGVILEELELNIGTLASIYLKPVQTVFRLSKHKELPYSPALQRRNLFHSGVATPQPQSRNLKEHSPGAGAGVSRRMSYRRTNSDNGSQRSTHFDETTNTQQHMPRENLAQKFSRKASFITNRIKS